MVSQNFSSPEEVEQLIPHSTKFPGYDSVYSIWGMPFDGPEVEFKQEVGTSDSAEERKRKQKAAAAREQYAKMTPEERAAKNQKRRNVPVEAVPEASQSQFYNEAKKKCSGAEKIQKILAEAAVKVPKPEQQLEPKKLSRYQRMTAEEKKASNKKKTNKKKGTVE